MKNSQLFKKYGIVVLLLLLCVFFSVTTESFLTAVNLLNVLRQVSIIGIVSVGMTFVMLAGGIDLSVGSQIGVTAVVVSTLMVKFGVSIWLSILVGVILSTVIGFITGLLVQTLDLPPMIATLGMMTILRGVAFIITSGMPVFGLPTEYTIIGQGYLWVIPIPVICMFVIFGVGKFVLDQTYIGRHFYAVGGNSEAARLSGINVNKIKILAFAISGFLCGVAGVILMSRVNTGQPSAATNMEMDVITATVLGGVSLSGGEGRIAGVLIGCMIMGVISNGLVILNVGEFYQMVAKGAILVFAVALDKFGQRYSAKMAKAAV